uniref:LanC-like protein 3 n=1 Tax=Globodera pallida TaxID=36090 RepID=A0A183BJN0_GLOPA
METPIILKLESPRNFLNPFIENPASGARCVTREWLLQKLHVLAERIMSRVIPLDEYAKDGPYVGPSGIVYSFVKAIRKLDSQSDQLNLRQCIRTILAAQTQTDHAIKKSHAHKCRYLTGSLGLLTVRAIADHHLLDVTDAASLSAQLRKLLSTVLRPGYQQIGDDEMLNGRAGFLASLLELRSHLGQELLPNVEVRSVLDAMVTSGRNYSKRHKSPAKLMYEWHDSEYLGAAHGVSGIYQMMLSFWDLLDEPAKADLKQSVDWLMGTQFPSGNFPSSSKWIGLKDELVHWCHGASGVLHMLIVARLVLNEDKYLESAERCANLIWAKGILHKGPGICHGVAGNGYAFLLLYRLTRKEQYLEKAKAFAFAMLVPSFENLARTPDSPWSLFEGWSGALCFLADLLEPAGAQFPLIPICFN